MKNPKAMPPPPKIGRPKKYNFDELLVGGNFFIPNGSLSSLRSLATRYSKFGKKFSVHDVGDGIEVWRRA